MPGSEQSESAPGLPRAEVTVGPAPPGPAPATLAVPELVAIAGEYPVQDGGAAAALFTTGMIQPFAGLSPAFGAPRAEGQLLPINSPGGQALFSLFGTSFGGNGQTTFGLPNLSGRIAIGGSPVGEMQQQSLTLTYIIAASASPTVPMPGMVALFGGNFAPD